MINYVSPINSQTGYGITGYNLWKSIFAVDNDTTLFPIGAISIDPLWNKENIIHSIDNILKYNKNAPCLKHFHANDLLFKPVGNGKYGTYTFFETNVLKVTEKCNLNACDVTFTASSWSKEVLLQNDISPKIVLCPPGVDTTIFNPELFATHKPDGIYRFINVGKWEVRKGHDVLVEVFNEAFNEDDDVELIMLNHNPFLNHEQSMNWANLYKESRLGSKIKVLSRLGSQKDVANVMSQCDCGIFPSRAEGWNNEAMEMMAMDKPIIITNYSAHTEYCDSTNSSLIHIDNLESAKDNIWFDGTGEWASLGENQKEQMIVHMREMYNNRVSSNPNGMITAQKYTWEKSASTIITELNSNG